MMRTLPVVMHSIASAIRPATETTLTFCSHKIIIRSVIHGIREQMLR
jgi:hypothetical protein